jgi:hypothetical protein
MNVRGGTTTVSQTKNSTPEKGQVIAFWYKSKEVLNEDISTYDDVATISTNKLISDIRFKMLAIKAESMSSDGGLVNYDNIKKSQSFQEYLSLVSKLQFIDMKSLSHYERQSFLINIYNCLIMHAIIDGKLDLSGM